MAASNQLARTPAAIWDLPLRIFHWSLLAAVATAGVTGFLLPVTWLDVHVIGGSAVAVLLLFRLVWGFTGSAYSRFQSFAFSPAAVIAYARQQLRGETAHHAGHNPLGAAMIFALLTTLAAIAVTGAMVLGGAEKQGILRAFLSYATGRAAQEIHQIAAYVLLILIAGHVGGVLVESRRTAENLPRSMVTGVKFVRGPIATARARPVVALLGVAIMAVGLGIPAFAMWQLPAAGVPQAALDPQYLKECGECHIPFHPSLRDTDAWASIMATLDDHFGEDASLDPDIAAKLATYLSANAAERWDTRAANVFRAGEPLRMTDTPYWKRRHGEIDASVFASKKVGTKSNCEACHGDARQGLFMPQAIDIPKE